MYGPGWKPYQNLEYTKYWSNIPTKRCRSLFFSTTPNDGFVQHKKSVSPTSHHNVFRIFWLKLHQNSSKNYSRYLPFNQEILQWTYRFFLLRLDVSSVDQQTVFHQKNTHAWCFFFASECVVPGGTATLRGIQSQFGLLKGTHVLREFFCVWKRCMFFSNKNWKHPLKRNRGEMRSVKSFCEAKRLKRWCFCVFWMLNEFKGAFWNFKSLHPPGLSDDKMSYQTAPSNNLTSAGVWF